MSNTLCHTCKGKGYQVVGHRYGTHEGGMMEYRNDCTDCDGTGQVPSPDKPWNGPDEMKDWPDRFSAKPTDTSTLPDAPPIDATICGCHAKDVKTIEPCHLCREQSAGEQCWKCYKERPTPDQPQADEDNARRRQEFADGHEHNWRIDTDEGELICDDCQETTKSVTKLIAQAKIEAIEQFAKHLKQRRFTATDHTSGNFECEAVDVKIIDNELAIATIKEQQ